ncbi:MAG TPA: hypothetical protein PKC21_02755 [Oligoflexia bacterium]|nr:hypothetical protein [Oligoflexia bacterium]HMR24252.1 hypothetical protein [Oligoflexia bacterium]
MAKNVSSIKKALDLLKQAAQEQKDDLQTLFSKEYEELGNVISELKPKFEETAKKVNQKTQDLSEDIIKGTQKEPLKALGIAAGIGFVLGLIVNKK